VHLALAYESTLADRGSLAFQEKEKTESQYPFLVHCIRLSFSPLSLREVILVSAVDTHAKSPRTAALHVDQIAVRPASDVYYPEDAGRMALWSR
jgi:hypothetical protein